MPRPPCFSKAQLLGLDNHVYLKALTAPSTLRPRTKLHSIESRSSVTNSNSHFSLTTCFTNLRICGNWTICYSPTKSISMLLPSALCGSSFLYLECISSLRPSWNHLTEIQPTHHLKSSIKKPNLLQKPQHPLTFQLGLLFSFHACICNFFISHGIYFQS